MTETVNDSVKTEVRTTAGWRPSPPSRICPVGVDADPSGGADDRDAQLAAGRSDGKCDRPADLQAPVALTASIPCAVIRSRCRRRAEWFWAWRRKR